jgi:phosphate-selective porin
MRAVSFPCVVVLFSVICPPLVFGQQFPPPLREGSGRFRWSSYVQLRYTAIDNGDDLFALRRLKLMIGGNLSPRVQWYAQGLFKDGNASPTDGHVYFQEAWLRYAWRKEVQFAAGQFKPPFGRERFTPDFEILTMDRSLVTDALTPDGPYVDSFYRDRGVQVDGEPHPAFHYAAGVFDGRGAQHGFHGVGPLLVGQLLFRPVRERPLAGHAFSLQFGGAYAARWGRDLPFRPCCATLETQLSHFYGADRRWQAEVSADWGGASLRAEYMRASLRFADELTPGFPASGYYVQISKYLTPRWQAVVKHEAFDPNLHIRNGKDVWQTTAGLNYYIRQNRAKVMAGYVHRGERAASVANDLIQVQLQVFIH